jgi:hypothetical protein
MDQAISERKASLDEDALSAIGMFQRLFPKP